MPGQDTADGQIDPVDDGESNPESPPYAPDVLVVVPRRHHHKPQRHQREQVKGRLGSFLISREPVTGAVHIRAVVGTSVWPLSDVVHDYQPEISRCPASGAPADPA